MRKLASIQRIHNIQDIEGKDKLKTCNVLGWQVLINTDAGHKENDLVVYVEIDSVLPPKAEFEFLASKKYRIRTMRMAGKMSEGIIFPLSVLPKGNYEEGQDVTKLLGVKKYESVSEQQERENTSFKKISMFRKFVQKFKWGRKYFPIKERSVYGFPSWISKTDETRVQNIPFVLEDGNQYEAREKLDGMSATFGIRRNKFGRYEYVVCSRNVNLTAKGYDSSSPYFIISDRYKLEERLLHLLKVTNFDSIVIQGEIIGSGIQGNKYKLPQNEIDFYLFNLIVDGESYHIENNVDDFHEIQKQIEGIKQVPLKGSINAYGENTHTVESILEFATFKSTLNKDTIAEGNVFRAYDKDSKVTRSFKVVSPQFLIKYKE